MSSSILTIVLMKTKKLVIYGIGETSEIVADYFKKDSCYDVVAFTVDNKYKKSDFKDGLPVISFEDIEYFFPPKEFQIFVAASYTNLNQDRERMFIKVKAKGYICASYISSKAFCWDNVSFGENVFVFENNVLQYKVSIGNNVILWSGNHIGHQSKIEDNCFISSHVVISGFCHVKKFSFLGVNSSISNGVVIGENNFLANGCVVTSNTKPNRMYFGNPAKDIGSSFEYFNID
jgi:sugar O-acyltransferase (sialic acid O-acetyltransferase NeuD family)